MALTGVGRADRCWLHRPASTTLAGVGRAGLASSTLPASAALTVPTARTSVGRAASGHPRPPRGAARSYSPRGGCGARPPFAGLTTPETGAGGDPEAGGVTTPEAGAGVTTGW